MRVMILRFDMFCPRFTAELLENNKHLVTGPGGNSEFCFPRIRGKQNSLFPKGPVIK